MIKEKVDNRDVHFLIVRSNDRHKTTSFKILLHVSLLCFLNLSFDIALKNLFSKLLKLQKIETGHCYF